MAEQTLQPDLLSLCGKVRDNEISTREFSALEDRLRSDSSARAFYLQFMSVCSALEQLSELQLSETKDASSLDAQTFDDSAWVEHELASDHLNSFPNASIPICPHPSKTIVKTTSVVQSRARNWTNWRGAAVLVAAVAATLLIAMTLPKRSTTESFAVMDSAVQPVWNGQNVLEIGAPISQGEYSLASGAVHVRYASGVELMIQAPSEFSITSATQATLARGSLSAFVPPAGRGFRVDTPFGSVVDHGTRIGVIADAEQGMEVHVFEGKAEAIPMNSTSGEVLIANEAAAMQPSETVFSRVAAQPAYFMEKITDAASLPHASGDIELRVTPPKAARVLRTELVDIGRATIFAENRVALDQDLSVTLTQPGIASVLSSRDQVIPAGTTVDSFLIHFTMPRKLRAGTEYLVASGSLQFDQPIAGVIAYDPAKRAKPFEHPATEYARGPLIGLEDSIDGDKQHADWLRLSDDRRTLEFRLQIHGREAAEQEDFLDQVRVLVSTP